MGYHTYYEVYVEPLQRADDYLAEREDLIAEPFPNAADDSWLVDGERATYGDLFDGLLGEMKWYDMTKDMCVLSAKYATWIFEVRVYGEDRDDLWGAWFCRGQHYREKAQILWPAFYPGYLADLPKKEVKE